MGEQERDGQEAVGASRSQHVVLQGSADARMIAAAVRPGVERSREGSESGAPGCIVIAPTIEQAFQAARQARAILGDTDLRVVPVSSVTRARRVVAAAPTAVVTGTANDLLALRRDAVLSFESVRAVVIIALDDVLAAGGADTLQALFADAPADTMRVVTLESETPDVASFLESHLRRARRVSQVPTPDRPLATVPRYTITTSAGRADSLRTLLDDLDPPSLVVIAQTDQGLREANDALAEMGVIVDDSHVRVTRDAPAEHVALAVFWEAPHTLEALEQALASRPVESIALLSPEEVPAFRRLSGNVAEAWTAAARKESASQRVNQLRTAIRSTLVNSAGATASELALIGPLLDSHDAVEIAAAALRLYEGARRELGALKARTASVPSVAMHQATMHAAASAPTGGHASAPSARDGGGKQRIFLAVGKRDNVRPGDLVGAIANEAGIPGDRIGTIELYESHATVELEQADAERALDVLRTVSVRGRKLNARIDTGTPGRSSGGDRGGARTAGRGDRPPFRSGGDRAPRSFDRGERAERAPRSFDRGERSDRGDRQDRAERPREDRGERGEREYRPRSDRPSSGPRLHRDAERGGERGADRGGDRGPRSGPPRSGPPRGGARGGPRGGATEARRAFGDRPPRERAESRGEWSERGERMKNARRTPPDTRPESGGEE